MTTRKFCLIVFTLSLIILTGFVAANYAIDLYGLFHNVKGRSISIYSDERTTKYLLAHNYVPYNFEAYIIGPSLSANLNPKEIADHKIYNLSMMGANITEEKAVVEKAMEKSKPRFVILCLHPYLTADHGMKTGMINSREYYGALGSVSLCKSYLLKFIRDHDLMPSKFPADQFNDYGCNHYNSLLQKIPVEEKIKEQLAEQGAVKGDIDAVAYAEFGELIDDFQRNKVEIIAYFHPLPFLIHERFKSTLDSYQDRMTRTLKGKATLIDFNSPQYHFFTKDLGNYIDHGHFSDQGQAFVLREILRRADRIH